MVPLVPPVTCSAMLEFQTSFWYCRFREFTIKCRIIRPLSEEFKRYLNADGVYIPKGSEDEWADRLYGILANHKCSCSIPSSSLSDREADDGESSEPDSDSDENYEHFEFPALDAEIRYAISEYSAVFPKLNFTAPKDAYWMLSDSSPGKCVSPADVYTLLKSSDLILHDVDEALVFEDCSNTLDSPYILELTLKKWYAVEPGREFRCFVRNGLFFAISQRYPNYYEYLQNDNVQANLRTTITQFWDLIVRSRWPTPDCLDTFDIVLTRDLEKCHILDFNPFTLSTDPLLFSFERLRTIFVEGEGSARWPVLECIDSQGHPSSNQPYPPFHENRIPFDALALSAGRDSEAFSREWMEAVIRSAAP